MRHYNNYMPVEIINEKDCVKNFNGYKKLGKKCFILTGKTLTKHCSVLDDLITALTRLDISYKVFFDVENNTSVETVMKASKSALDFGADFIIGAGGGSPMDAAKAVALIAANKLDFNHEDIFTREYKSKPLPLILIGTTAGTGSEVTPAAVLTTPLEGIFAKKTLKTPFTYATYALCDPQYTYSLPFKVTVSTALDSVSHAIEAYYSKKGGEFARIYALEALRLVVPALDDFINSDFINSDFINNDFIIKKEKSQNIRERLFYGSIIAGMAINNGGTSFPHSLGYVLSTMHDIPHGAACALFLGEFLSRVNKIENIEPVLQAAGEETLESFNNKINKRILMCCEIPEITEYELKKFCDVGVLMPSLGNSVLSDIGYSDCHDIYKNVCKQK